MPRYRTVFTGWQGALRSSVMRWITTSDTSKTKHLQKFRKMCRSINYVVTRSEVQALNHCMLRAFFMVTYCLGRSLNIFCTQAKYNRQRKHVQVKIRGWYLGTDLVYFCNETKTIPRHAQRELAPAGWKTRCLFQSRFNCGKILGCSNFINSSNR